MSQHLKKILYLGLATLMVASTGVTLSTGYNANASRRNRIEKVYHHKNKNNRRNGKKRVNQRRNKVSRRSRRSRKAKAQKKQNVKRYNRKAKRMNHKRRAKKQTRKSRVKALKSRFKRSNNKRALKRSGFFDAHLIGGDFIFNKYAPNDKRAVVPKHMNVSNWYKGKFGQANPTAYYYDTKLRGWIVLK